MTKEEKRWQAEKEVLEAMKSGVPVVNLDIFEKVSQVKLNETVKNQLDYTLDLYKEYQENILKITPALQKHYLETLKNEDIINNQEVEKENSFLLALYYSIHSKNAMDDMLKWPACVTPENFVKAHDKLLEGTSSEDKKGLRHDNLKFVGTYVAGQREIDYFPILENDIDQAVKSFLNLLNNAKIENEQDAFLKPLSYHGLLAALQLFQDGNTRYARLIQHLKLWEYTNEVLKKQFPLPIIYATKQYAASRSSYREYIKNIAVLNDDEAWNQWFIFNLKCLQNNIWVNESNIQTLQRRKML